MQSTYTVPHRPRRPEPERTLPMSARPPLQPAWQQPLPQAAPPLPYPRIPARRGRPLGLRLLLLGGGLGLGMVVLLFAGAALLLNSAMAAGDILPNVRVVGPGIGEQVIGGMMLDEAVAHLNGVPVDRPIVLRDGDRTWTVSSADLGISVNGAVTAHKAAQVGQHDGLMARAGKLFNGAQLPPVYAFDAERAQATLTAMRGAIDVAPQGITTPGRRLNVDATLGTITTALDALLAGGTLDLAMDVIEMPRTVHVVQHGEELNLIAKKYNVPVSEIIALNNIANPDFINPGQELIIPAAGLWVPGEQDAPPAPTASGRAIVISLSNQRIYAYEDGRLVRSSLTSTGKFGTETVRGDYKVYAKYAKTRMRGPDYDIPDVPWTMYFYKGYAVHGAYWHNVFGRPASHGCVNLPLDEAKWFYDFAPIGTLVRVIA